MKTRILSLLIGAALCGVAVQAAEPAKAPAKAPTAQQQAAREEIDRLVKRIEELSKQLGEGNDVRVIVHRVGGQDGMPMPGMHGDHVMMLPKMREGMDKEGMRQVWIERRGPGGEGGERELRFKQIGDPGWRPGPGLGIVMAPNAAAAGVKIAAVTPDSPAYKSGLRAGDVLLAVDGKSISGSGSDAMDKARDLLGDLKQDQVVKLRYARQGKTAEASVKADEIHRLMVFNRGGGDMMPRHDGEMHKRMMMLPPGVEMEIERVGPDGPCKKGEHDCRLPALLQAFRWQGLNLASVDAGLGRYFGTDKGVLVISAGPELKGLQSGDVIQRVGTEAVDSPRDAMKALRAKDAGSQVSVQVLRDRKPVTVNVTVPESRPLPFIDPPAPPAPPAAPPPPPNGRLPRVAPPAPPATPPPPPAAWHDEDGEDVEVEVVVAG